MEKMGILFSHFYIYKFLKILLVKIFLYNIDLEKNTYAFYARGIGIFSDSFHYRFKKKKKKREPLCYDRFKPDLFFPLFMYYVYCSKKEVEERFYKTKGFKYVILKNKIKIKKKKKFNFFFYNKYDKEYRLKLRNTYLNGLKKGDLELFFKKSNISKEKKKNIDLTPYEKKIKKLNSKKLNLGFLDFFFYLFFKINMLERDREDLIRSKRRRKKLEMILDYPKKIKKWIFLIKKFLKLNIIVGDKHKGKRSVKNFIFFLVFLINLFYKIKNKSGRVKKIKLNEINIKLVRIFVFNKLLNEFASFYGAFLSNIVSIFTKMYIKKSFFKFCYITHNSINAKFITRYIGLKLKKKFPLFHVINPLKKEFHKLAYKKRRKKYYLLSKFFFNKVKSRFKHINLRFKHTFKITLIYLFKKYLEISFYFFKKYKTLITIDLYIYLLILKDKYKYKLLLKIWKKKFKKFFKFPIWNKKKNFIYLNNKWIVLLLNLIKNKKKYKIFFSRKLKILSCMHKYVKNKLFINLFFSFNKYSINGLSVILSNLKENTETFFHFNTGYLILLIYEFFQNYNYNISNINTLLTINPNNLTMSNYFFKSYMIYLYTLFSFRKFSDYININRRKNYLKEKQLYSTTSFILGYKMSFKGRFTRKQRASSVWFHQGFVPLNTFKGYIDYSFFTIPLKNSAVSIKLWLYKNKNNVIWDYKFLSQIM
jgi:hypothetical protein